MGREIVVVLAVVGTVGVSAGGGTGEQEAPSHRSAQAALRYFQSVQDADFQSLLRQLRRPAPSPAVREIVIRNLPKEGEVVPTPREAAKLAAIRPVLAFHGRADDMELRLIALGGQAVAGLHARTVLLISREAVGVVDVDKLVAIVAHEIGHDYIWTDYHEAQRQQDFRLLQELELRCDGIAIITMDRLGVNPERLVSAVTKLARYNLRVMGRSCRSPLRAARPTCAVHSGRYENRGRFRASAMSEAGGQERAPCPPRMEGGTTAACTACLELCTRPAPIVRQEAPRERGGRGYFHAPFCGRSAWVITNCATWRPNLAPTSSAVRKWMPDLEPI